MPSQNMPHQALSTLQEICLQQNVPFVSYRLPEENTINTLIQHQSFPEQVTNPETINNQKGFIMAPFSESEGYKTYLLKPDLCFENDTIPTDIYTTLEKCNLFLDARKQTTDFDTTTKNEFESNVRKAVTAMNNGEFIKVVLSKTQVLDFPENFTVTDFYGKLCHIYPHAFVYIIQLPNVGCWIGATPEPLLTSDSNTIKTVSLAGTQPATETPIELYNWSEKELEEQGIVTGFIEQTLRSAGISNFIKFPVENYRAANLIHLKSGFEFNKNEMVNSLSSLVNALHPTPSVGGLPKQEAYTFIKKTELHNRSYYTGFLGVLNEEGSTSLFVNLRCMQIIGNRILLYSGAGITSSSIPENEWTETENKFLTLKQVIFSR